MASPRFPRMTLGLRVALLASLLCSGWLLSTSVLPNLVVDLFGFGGWLIVYLLAGPVFAFGLLWSVGYLLHVVSGSPWAVTFRSRGDWRHGMLPLGIVLGALMGYLFAPLAWYGDLLDFWAHRAVRIEVVDRVESGDLRPFSAFEMPLVSLNQYPWSVSMWGDKRRAMVYSADGALHIVFFPARRVGERSAFVYRSDGRPPSVLSEYLPGISAIQQSDPLADRWYRVVY
jgi:hypothetical protein